MRQINTKYKIQNPKLSSVTNLHSKEMHRKQTIPPTGRMTLLNHALYLVFTVIAGTSCILVEGAKANRKAPNVLFILADQMRFDAIEPDNTPNLYQMGLSGARFTSAYSSTPSCTPGRAAILTGLSPWRHGMLGYGEIADRYEWELPRVMNSLGYLTAAIGKNHFGWTVGRDGEFQPKRHGYQINILYDGIVDEPDDYHQWFKEQTGRPAESGWPGLDMNSWRGEPYVYEERLHPTAWAGRQAVRFIRNAEKESRPWMLKVSFHRPHSPYDPPKRLFDEIKYVSPPVHCDPRHPLAWDERFKSGKECGPQYVDAWCGDMPLEALYAGKRGYAANVRFVDEWIGKVLRVVKETGQDNETFVLFTSDHGDAQGDHFLWRKTYPYEISSHIPMLIRWPKYINSKSATKPGSVFRQVVELRDIFPTFVDVAGEKERLKYMQLGEFMCFTCRAIRGCLHYRRVFLAMLSKV